MITKEKRFIQYLEYERERLSSWQWLIIAIWNGIACWRGRRRGNNWTVNNKPLFVTTASQTTLCMKEPSPNHLPLHNPFNIAGKCDFSCFLAITVFCFVCTFFAEMNNSWSFCPFVYLYIFRVLTLLHCVTFKCCYSKQFINYSDLNILTFASIFTLCQNFYYKTRVYNHSQTNGIFLTLL